MRAGLRHPKPFAVVLLGSLCDPYTAVRVANEPVFDRQCLWLNTSLLKQERIIEPGKFSCESSLACVLCACKHGQELKGKYYILLRVGEFFVPCFWILCALCWLHQLFAQKKICDTNLEQKYQASCAIVFLLCLFLLLLWR